MLCNEQQTNLIRFNWVLLHSKKVYSMSYFLGPIFTIMSRVKQRVYTTSENSGCLLLQTRDGYWRYSLNHTGDVQ